MPLFFPAHLVIFAENMTHSLEPGPQIPSATEGVKVQLAGQRVTSTFVNKYLVNSERTT